MNTEGTAVAAPETALARAIRWLARPDRETGIVAAFYFLLTIAIFLPILTGTNGQVIGSGVDDLERQFIHWRQFGFGQMAAGHLPLWNPHIYGGTQYFGGFQAALLYPPNWLYLFLPLSLAINVGIALHVFLAGWFMYFWVRHRGLHVVAAMMAGVLFMLGGTYFPHIYAGHLPNLCTMVWGPLILLAIDGWFSRQTVPWLLLGGGALAMQLLAGHPQYVFYTGVACALYTLTKPWRDLRSWRTLAGLAVIPLVGVALSAVQVFEGLHAGAESLRSKGTTLGFAGNFSFPPDNLITLITPGFFGDAVTNPYWGRHLFWEMCPFIGISGLVLAAYALFRVRTREVWVCAGIAGVLFVMALGRYTPLFEPLYYYAPGFNKFRGWSKLLYPTMLFVVILSASGLDLILRRGVIGREVGPVLLVAALALGGAGLWADWSAHLGAAESPAPWSKWLPDTYYTGESMNYVTESPTPPYVQAAAKAAGRALLVSAASCLVLAAAFFAGRRWRAALFAVPVIALAEMLVFALPTLATYEFAPNRRYEVAEYLKDHPIGDGRVLDLENPNTGMTTGENDVWGYDPGVTRRYAEFIAVTQGLTPDLANQDLRFRRVPDIYATLLRCRYAFGALQEATQKIAHHTFNPALAAPHVMLVPEVRVVAQGDGVLRAMTAPFDPRATVVLENPPDPRPAEHPAPGKATVIAETTDSLTIEADLPDPAVLVVTDAYSDGWTARSLLRSDEGGGQTTYHVMPADHCLRAVPLSSGHHRFLLEYRPKAFLLGAWVSVIGLLVYLAAIGWLVWTRRFRRQEN